MSFNQFMHPRNIYRIRPNFTELSKQYPDFGENVLYDDNGNAHLNYSNVKALKSLTKTLLKHDFNLDVEIPDGRLVPTLPMRLNYLLWIEDLLNRIGNDIDLSQDIVGFDIGTGCCAVFPLLGVRMNSNWRFLASDIDDVNLKYSKENILRNNLQDKIKVFENRTDKMFFPEIINYLDNGQQITFTMTNPPFFDDDFDVSNLNPNLKNFHNKKIQETSSNESKTTGGEVSFVNQIIQESLSIHDKIKLFTVLLGRKKSFNELKMHLEHLHAVKEIASFTHTELCQGNTKRWALAWSFSSTEYLSGFSPIKCKNPKELNWIIPRTEKLKPYNLENLAEIVKNILYELQLQIEIIQGKKWPEFEVKSNINTWSHQRRKRRQKTFQADIDSHNENICVTPKRQHDSENEDEHLISLSQTEDKKKGKKTNPEISGICKTDLTILLHCVLTVKRYQSEIEIKICPKEMCRNNESVYQLLQFLRNRLSN